MVQSELSRGKQALNTFMLLTWNDIYCKLVYSIYLGILGKFFVVESGWFYMFVTTIDIATENHK